jgi:hypothetical protein
LLTAAYTAMDMTMFIADPSEKPTTAWGRDELHVHWQPARATRDSSRSCW